MTVAHSVHCWGERARPPPPPRERGGGEDSEEEGELNLEGTVGIPQAHTEENDNNLISIKPNAF